MGLFSWLFGAPAVEAELPGPGFFEVEAVGESNYQPAIKKARHGAAEGRAVEVHATLILESDNPHDKLAVRVDIEGRTVGYLDRDNARAYRNELKRVGHPSISATCAAKIVGGGPRPEGGRKMLGVLLDIPTVD